MIYTGKFCICMKNVIFNMCIKFEDERDCVPPLHLSSKVLCAWARPYIAINGEALSKLSQFDVTQPVGMCWAQ